MSDPKRQGEPWVAQQGPQLEAIRRHLVGELFFGGAVGGGKSDFLLGDFAQDVPQYGPAWQGILFRKSYPQLEELIARSKEIYPAWFGLKPEAWSATAKQWNFPNGSVLKMRHAENDDSYMEYQGHQYTWEGFDELPHWATPNFYRQLKVRLRSAKDVPNKRIRATGNPGGVGHGWIKQYWQIDKYPRGSQLILPEVAGGMTRMFVASKVTDNKILLANDPEYVLRLGDIGSPELVKMYLEGDWNVIAGAYFPEFSANKHVIEPFPIPSGWVKYRAMDWGSARPFCVLWFAVSDGSVYPYPPGALICYREWYGADPKEINIGLKLTAEEVAQGIKDREDEKLDMGVIDPSAFKEDGGPSIASRMANKKVYFHKADNNRKTGWDMVRHRLKGFKDYDDFLNMTVVRPMIYFFANACPDTVRTLPMLQHDRGKSAVSLEDVDTTGEDHAGDTVRYACMARPWVRPGSPASAPAPQFAGTIQSRQTINELIAAARKARIEREQGY
jgi:hypothetical protein